MTITSRIQVVARIVDIQEEREHRWTIKLDVDGWLNRGSYQVFGVDSKEATALIIGESYTVQLVDLGLMPPREDLPPADPEKPWHHIYRWGGAVLRKQDIKSKDEDWMEVMKAGVQHKPPLQTEVNEKIAIALEAIATYMRTLRNRQ